MRDPHAISDKGSFCRESTRGELAVDRQSVFADEVDRHTDTELCIGHVPVMSLLPELLQHQRGFAELEPAPAKLALVDPLLRHLEAESVDVKAPRRFDIVDPEEGNGLQDIGFGCGCCCHTPLQDRRWPLRLRLPTGGSS